MAAAAGPSADEQLKTDLELVHAQLLARSPIYAFLLANLRLVSVRPPQPQPQQPGPLDGPSPPPAASVLAHLPLTSEHLNSHGSLHGAVAATIVDWAGGIVIASLPRAPAKAPAPAPAATSDQPAQAPSALTTPRGVSVDIHLRYLSAAARLGHTLIVRAWSHKLGRSLAFVTVQLSVQPVADDPASAVVVVEASHTKYI